MKKLLAFLLCSTLVLGDSSGPTSGTATGSGWTNPANVGASDNAYATYSIGGLCVDCGTAVQTTTALYISSLGFALPASSTVTGITATFEHKCSGTSSCYSSTVQLTKTAGAAQGTNKGTSTRWSASDTTDTLGTSSDLWGATWTQGEVNATGFGMLVIVSNSNGSTRTASVDYMALTVSYTPSGSGSHRRTIISQTRTIPIHG